MLVKYNDKKYVGKILTILYIYQESSAKYNWMLSVEGWNWSRYWLEFFIGHRPLERSTENVGKFPF